MSSFELLLGPSYSDRNTTSKIWRAPEHSAAGPRPVKMFCEMLKRALAALMWARIYIYMVQCQGRCHDSFVPRMETDGSSAWEEAAGPCQPVDNASTVAFLL